MLESPLNAAELGDVTVEEADDGNTAIQALQAAAEASRRGNEVLHFHVMSAMNGSKAVQIMQRSDLRFKGGILGVTGRALPSDLTYNLVITKPLTNKKLMDAVRSVIQNNYKRNILE